MDRHLIDKHKEKIENYLDLAIELRVLWNSNVEVVPLVFGALGTLHEKIVKNFELLQLTEVSVGPKVLFSARFNLQFIIVLNTACNNIQGMFHGHIINF